MENSVFSSEELAANASYVLSILKSQLTKVWAWGFHKPIALVYNEKKSLKFSVDGFVHKGYVYVSYNEGADLFEVYIVNQDGSVKEEIKGVYFDMLIDIIDWRVETGGMTEEEYAQEVKKDLLSKGLLINN